MAQSGDATFYPSAISRRPVLLLVDDQAINLQILSSLFKKDCDIIMAHDGEEALAACEKRLPDLILLDVVMPGMDGNEVCRQLKIQPHTHDIPVIFITGRSDPQEEAAGLELGAVDYIAKPINAAVVRARVRTHLELRFAMQQLANSEHIMEQRVAERSAELQTALDILHHSQEELVRSEAKATLGTLIASVSHELGTPLGNSMLMANTLADHAKDLNKKVENNQLKRSDLSTFLGTLVQGTELIRRNLGRATDLLKNFKQVASDQASEQRREFMLAQVVREVLNSLSPSLKLHPHCIFLDIPEDIRLDSYPGALGQVVINLINNAYLHAFEDRRNGILNINAQMEGDYVLLSCRDNGVGISQENLEQLFHPFFSTKIGRGGTGLGMTIVENLVNKTLGGEIQVRSTPNEGTTFEIRIPQKAPEATE